MHLLFLNPGADGGVCRVRRDVTVQDGLLQRSVENPVKVFDRLGGMGFELAVIEALDHVRRHGVQPNGTHCGLNVVLDRRLIGVCCGFLHADQIFLRPNVQPFAKRHFAGVQVGAFVDAGSCCPKLFRHFLLGLPVDRALNLLPGSGIIPRGVTCFPVSIFFPI